MQVQLAFYKGPPTDFVHKVSHVVTCTVLSIRTSLKLRKFYLEKYSHTEICIDGICYSSSVRDKGVRSKVIDLDSGKWDLVDITDISDRQKMLEVFNKKKGRKYDWLGALGFGLPFLKQDKQKEFCFEINAEMLEMPNPSKATPWDFMQYVKRKR